MVAVGEDPHVGPAAGPGPRLLGFLGREDPVQPAMKQQDRAVGRRRPVEGEGARPLHRLRGAGAAQRKAHVVAVDRRERADHRPEVVKAVDGDDPRQPADRGAGPDRQVSAERHADQHDLRPGDADPVEKGERRLDGGRDIGPERSGRSALALARPVEREGRQPPLQEHLLQRRELLLGGIGARNEQHRARLARAWTAQVAGEVPALERDLGPRGGRREQRRGAPVDRDLRLVGAGLLLEIVKEHEVGEVIEQRRAGIGLAGGDPVAGRLRRLAQPDMALRLRRPGGAPAIPCAGALDDGLGGNPCQFRYE